MISFVFVTLLISASAIPAPPLSDNQLSKCEGAFYTRINISTSPFMSIMNVRVDSPEAVYSTPPVMLIGQNDGDILRCRQDDPEVCEDVFNTKSNVYSLVVVGEYFFAGLHSGVIYKCKLNEKDCMIFLKDLSHVESLASGSGYLYVGLFNGTISRCQLNDPNSCQPFHEPGSHVYALIEFNGNIYAGLWDGKMMSCSLKTKNNCSLVYTMTAGVMGFTTVGHTLFAVTWDGRMWNCTWKSEDASHFCASVSLGYSNPREIASFNGVLYTLENDKGIYKCKWANNTECTHYGSINRAHSMAFAYGTYQMQSRFKTEDTTCKWQSASRCPPVVNYYEAHERALLNIHVKNGKLYNSLGVLVDTSNADEGSSGPAAIFAMGPDGTILLSNLHKRGLLHTSSFFAGSPVSGAGEMVVEQGVIKKIRACSEHYQSDLTLNGQVIQSLKSQGYAEPINIQMCGEDDKLDQSESNSIQ